MDDNESIAVEKLGNLGRSEITLKSNGVCHVEDVNDKLLEEIKTEAKIAISPSETVISPEGIGSSSPSVRLRKWKRIPREVVKNPGSNKVNGNSNVVHGDSGLDYQPVLATNSEDQSNRSLSAASAPRTRPKISNSNGGNSVISVHSGDQKSNGRSGTSKKARGFKIEKENSDSNMGNFVFVQGINSGNSAKYDEEECNDDKLVNNEAESEDVTQEEKIEQHEVSFDQDALVESITGFDSALEELEREVNKWKDIGIDEALIIDDSIDDMLELKDAKIMELESTITTLNAKTEIDDLLKEEIQAEVEIVAINTTTKSLITGHLNEMKHNIQQENMQAEKLEIKEEDVKKVENKVLKKQETEEDVKKLKNRVCRLSSCLMIQFILLYVTFYLDISCQNVGLVPT